MIDGKPLVSCIIPVFNGERYLAEALESVFKQDYRPFEVIVVDDGSTDNSAEIAKSFAVRYIYQSNQGVAYAWATGIAAAKGELIAFLAQDDLWTPDKLSVQVSHMVSHPQVQYTVARVKCFLEPGLPIPHGFRKELLEKDFVGRIQETLVARRSLFEAIGAFDTNLTTSHDVDWFARVKDAGILMAVIPKVLLHRRIHDANQTFSALPEEGDRNLLRVLRRSVRRQHAQKPQT